MTSWKETLRKELNDIIYSAPDPVPRDLVCIHKLPASVTNAKAEAYNPRIVSFGPYHHDEQHLKAMEEHKHRAVKHFFEKSKGSIDQFLVTLEEYVRDLKHYYPSMDPFWQENTGDFLKLMTWDGCFMLEILSLTSPLSSLVDGDPIFSQHGNMYNIPSIKRDMLLVQNQLPLLVLRLLLSVHHGFEHTDTAKKNGWIHESLHVMICEFFSLPLKEADMKATPFLWGSHLLKVYINYLVYDRHHDDFPLTRTSSLAQDSNGHIFWSARSVREMQEAGILIRNNKSRCLNRIGSISGARLDLPIILVDDLTEILLLNIKEFERLMPGKFEQEVTGYIFFMATIIHDAKDVSLLRSLGIIQNRGTATDEDIVQLFQLLSRDVMPDPHSHYLETQQKLQNYCNRRYSRGRGYIMGTYFRNPWASISVIASIVLFVLTSAQTLYTIFPYYNK